MMQINPMWQNAFKPELINNLKRVSNNFTKQLLIMDVAKECIMYSCDMCLEYYRQGAFAGITPSTIDNITYNVCVAMNSIVKEFEPAQHEDVMKRVRAKMSDSSNYASLQQEVNRYYGNY
ncbi:MAG: hypothetical protein IJZ11_01500 [Bacteroidaceae bacterium]|nr:hypothetical protein [Bacteroidaceae bacterium]